MHLKRNIIDVDMLVIGSEGAGSRAAIEGAKAGLKTMIVTKGVFTKCGATLTADMDIDLPSKDAKDIFGLPGDDRDTKEAFAADMFEEGKYMNNEEVVMAHCSNAAYYIKELSDWGMKIMGLTQSPGHRYPRGIVSTGRSMMAALKRATQQYDIIFREHSMVTNLLTSKNRVAGAVGIDMRTGEFLIFKAKAVLLATGGAMRVYPITTAPEELTGDGIFMAYQAGAKLVDMEFPMFLPACLYWPESMLGADFPYIFSTGGVAGWWLNKFGERFISKWDPVRMEIGTTRDIASIAQFSEILAGRCGPHGGIWVSFKHLPDELISYSAEAGMPWWRNFVYGNFNLKEFNMDPREVSFEVGPASHYWNGGIKINAKGETSVEGLFAAGEVQGGTMGANRLSGNAVTECLVFGVLAGKNAADYIKSSSSTEINVDEADMYMEQAYNVFSKKGGLDIYEIRKKIQELAIKYIGPIRDEEGLNNCIDEVAKIKNDIMFNQSAKSNCRIYNREWITAIENKSLIQTLEIVAKASLMRKESRGAMYRKDYPETDNKDWLKNIFVTSKDNEVNLEAVDVKTKLVELPKREKIDYMIPDWKYEKRI